MIDGAAHGISDERLTRIGAYIERAMAARHLPGACLRIERGGACAFEAAWGVRDPAGSAPMTTDALFRIYSMTKPIVSLVIMMLVEEGRLILTAPVSDFVPEFATTRVAQWSDGEMRLREPARPMTVHDLLRHTSGLTYGNGSRPIAEVYRRNLATSDCTIEEFCARLAALPLAQDPGTVWDYSHSTDVLGRVIEVVTGQNLSQALDARVLGPLGMRDTAFSIVDIADHGRLAEPFEDDTPYGPGTRLSDPRRPRLLESGGGGLVSSLGDYARFTRMLLARGTWEGHTYVSPATLAYMTADHVGPSTAISRLPGALITPGYGFGLGFSVRLETGGAPAPGAPGEYGWSGVGGTYFWVDPREDLFVVFMAQAPRRREDIRPALRGLIYGALVDRRGVPG